MSALEDRYRRLLRWYPVEHRRVHEEEMLGVLLAAAGPDRTRPAVRDVLDLVRGGLGIRLQRAPQDLARGGWQDAAALLNIMAPLLLLADALQYAARCYTVFPMARYIAARGESWFYIFNSAPSLLLWVAVAVTALCGARRTTAAVALVAALADFAGFVWYDDYAGGAAAAPLLLGLVTVAAVLAGPGPARGRKLFGRAGLISVTVALAMAAPLHSNEVLLTLHIGYLTARLVMATAILLAVAWLARGAGGRRALIVLAAPLYAIVAPFYPAYIESPVARFLITMVAIPVAVGVAALVTVTVVERLVIRPVAARRSGSAG